jgi:hypothetical protein
LALKCVNLLFCAFIRLSSGESHVGVVVYGVHTVGQHFFKSGEVHGVAVAVKEEDVVGIDLANRLLYVLVPHLQASVLWICRLVHRVVSGNLHCLSIEAPWRKEEQANIPKHS